MTSELCSIAFETTLSVPSAPRSRSPTSSDLAGVQPTDSTKNGCSWRHPQRLQGVILIADGQDLKRVRPKWPDVLARTIRSFIFRNSKVRSFPFVPGFREWLQQLRRHLGYKCSTIHNEWLCCWIGKLNNNKSSTAIITDRKKVSHKPLNSKRLISLHYRTFIV